MFTAIVITLHIVVSVIMVLFILLQTGKGADIGAVFGGGGSHTLFGSSGAATFLSKVTIVAAVTFMLTSITLSYFTGKRVPVERSIMTERPATQAPVAPSEGKPATAPEGAAKSEPVGKPETGTAPTQAPSPAGGEKSPAPSGKTDTGAGAAPSGQGK